MNDATVDPRFVERERQPGLDLLRAIAIIIVVLYHGGLFGFALPDHVHRFGWIGVDLFFVLSGYLIGGQLLAGMAQRGGIRLKRFYIRRALRIMPVYLAVVAAYFACPAVREYPQMAQPLWKFLLSLQNVALHGGTTFSHAWSLAIEDQFYLALPFLLLQLQHAKRAAFIAPIAIVLAGIALRWYLAQSHLNGDGTVSFRAFQAWIYYPTWTRLDPLVFGVAIAALQRFRPRIWKRLTNVAPWLAVPAMALLVFALWLGEGNLTVTACTWQLPLIALGMSALLLFVLSRRVPLSRTAVPGAAFIASISYSVYLSHKMLMNPAAALAANAGWSLDSAPAILLLQLVIYAAGAALFFAIERPFLILRKRIAH